MNEEVINDLYNNAVSKGYKKSREEFVSLLQSNDAVMNDMYSYVQSKGYKKGIDDFKGLIGATVESPMAVQEQPKKKDTGLPSGVGFSASPASTPDPEALRFAELVKKQGEITHRRTDEPGYIDPRKKLGMYPTREEADKAITQALSDISVTTGKTPELGEYDDVDYFTGSFGNVLRGFDKVSQTGLGELVDDIGRSFAQGYAQGDLAQASNKVIRSGNEFTEEDIQSLIDKSETLNSLPPSQEFQKYLKTYEEEGKSVWGAVKGLMENPTVLGEVAVSSLVGMATNRDAVLSGLGTLAAAFGAGAATGGTAGTFVVPGIGTAVGGTAAGLSAAVSALPYAFGAASTVVETGATFAQLLQEELGTDELGNPIKPTKENVKAILEDPQKFEKIRNDAIARGFTVGIIDAVGGKLATGVGAKILRSSARATGSVTKSGLVKALGTGGVIEGGAGATGEVLGQVVIDRPIDTGNAVLEFAAEMPGAIRTTLIAGLRTPMYKVNGERVSAEVVDDLINTMTPEQLLATKIDIANDFEGRKEKIQDKIVTGEIANQVREAQPDLNDATVNAIVDLQKQLNTLEGNKTQVAKDRAALLRARIKELQENQIVETKPIQEDAIQEQAAGQVPVQPGTGVGQEVAQGEPQAEPQGITKENIQEKIAENNNKAEELRNRQKAELEELNKRENKNYADAFDILNVNEYSQDQTQRSQDAIDLANRHEKEFNDLLQEKRNIESEAEKLNFSDYNLTDTNKLDRLRESINSVYQSNRNALDEGFEVSVNALDEANSVGASDYVAHGMGKTSLANAYNDLINLFNKGINPIRGRGSLDVAPLSGGVSTGTTASGNAYMDGPFTLVANRNHSGPITDINQIGGIIVNEGLATPEVLTSLRELFPNLVIESTSNTRSLVEQLNTKPQVQEEVAPTQQPDIEGEVSRLEQLFAEQETAPTKAAGVSILNDTDVEELRNRTQSKSQQATTQEEKNSADTRLKVIDTAKKAINTLKSVLPNVDIIIHDDEGSYNAAMAEVDGVSGSRGNFFIDTTPDGKTTGRIDINLSKANSRTVAHEIAHGILLKTFGDNKNLFNDFRTRLSKVLKADVSQSLNNFANKYVDRATGKLLDVNHEEFLAELTGVLEQQETNISVTTMQKVAALINEFISKITGGKFKPFEDTKNTKDVVDFFNTISGAIREGKGLEGVTEKINKNAEPTGTNVDTSSLKKRSSLIEKLGLERFSDMNQRITEGITLNSLGDIISHLTFSDRLVTGRVGNKDYLGGILFAAATNRVWASFTKGRVSQIISGMPKNEDGYRYLMPALLTEGAHMSNKDMSNTAIKLVEDAISNGDISPVDADSRIRKALNRKGLESFSKLYSDTIGNNKLTPELVISAIDNAIVKSNSTFEDRNTFLESLLGKADIDLKKRFGTLPSYNVLANGLAEPITNRHEFGDILLVIRTKGDLVAVQPKDGDPDYHPSYPWVIRSVNPDGSIADVETLIFDQSYNAVNVFPEVTNKQGQKFTYQQYVDKYGEGAKSRYLGYMGARSAMSTSVTEKIATEAQPKSKIVSKSQLDEATPKSKRVSRSQIIGENADLEGVVRHNLGVAKILSREGVSPERIKLVSMGWELGSDGKWRYEIPDGKFKENIDISRPSKLKDIFDAPDLFKAYPEARNIEVEFKLLPETEGGNFDPDTKSIIINRSRYKNNKQAAELTMLHEIQHWIQVKELFQGGSNTVAAKFKMDKIVDYFEKLVKKRESIYDTARLFYSDNQEVVKEAKDLLDFAKGQYDILKELTFEKGTKEEKVKAAEMIKNLSEYAKRGITSAQNLIDELSKKNPADAFNLYYRVAGEVEARNVEYRNKLTKTERRNILLSDTENIDREDQIMLDSFGFVFEANQMKDEFRVSRSQLDDQNRINKLINDARAQGFSEEAIILFLQRKGLTDNAIDTAMGKEVPVKTGVPELFKENPELANIGTTKDYSAYLDTIFPDSEVNNIAYHGSNYKFDNFKKAVNPKNVYKEGEYKAGFFFSKDKETAKSYIDNKIIAKISNALNLSSPKNPTVYPVVLDIKNPVIEDRDGKRGIGFDEVNEAYDNKNDAYIAENVKDPNILTDVYVVFKPEQIHILGSKKDIEDFKKFVSSKPKLSAAKKVEVTEEFAPGYNRVLNEIFGKDGIVDKSRRRGRSEEDTLKNAIDYLQQDTKVYENATDVQREAMVRNLRKEFNKREKAAPSAEKIIGKPKRKQVTVEEMAALKDQIKLEARAAREAKGDLNTKRKALAARIIAARRKGTITAVQARALVNRISKVNLDNPIMVDRLLEYTDKVFDNANYAADMAELRKLQKQAKSRNHTSMTNVVNQFTSINPEDIPLDRIQDYKEALDFLNTRTPFYGNMNEVFDEMLSYKIAEKFDAVKTKDALMDKYKSIMANEVKTVEDYVALIKDLNAFKRKAFQLLQNDAITQEEHDDLINGAGETQSVIEKKFASQITKIKKDLIAEIKNQRPKVSRDFSNVENDLIRKYLELSDADLESLSPEDLFILNDLLDNISNGEIDNFRFNEIISKAYTSDGANRLAKQIDDSKFDMTPEEGTKELSEYESSFWEGLLGMGRAKSGALQKFVVSVFNRAISSYESLTRDGYNEFLKLKKKYKMSDKDMHKIGMLTTYLQEYMAQFDPKNKNVKDIGKRDWFKEILSSKSMRGKYSSGKPSILKVIGLGKSEIDIIEEIWNSLPKDKDGNVDPKAVYDSYMTNDGKFFTKNEKGFFDDVMAYKTSEITPKQKFANEINGALFKEIPFHMMRVRLDGGKTQIAPTASSDNGVVRIKAGTGKERVSEAVGPIMTNFEKLFITNLEQTGRDYFLSGALKDINNTLSGAKKKIDPDKMPLLDTISGTLSEALGYEFDRTRTELILRSLLSARAATTLLNPIRTAIELGATLSSYPLRAKTLSGYKDLFGKQKEMSKLLEFTNSPLRLRQNINNAIDINDGRIEPQSRLTKATAYLSGLPERTMMVTSWMPTFRSEFKDITGLDFDIKKFNDSEAYREKYGKAVKEASAVADAQTEKIIGPTTKAGQRREVRIAPKVLANIIGLEGTVSKNTAAGQILGFFSNYPYREVTEFVNGFKEAAEVIKDEGALSSVSQLQKPLGIALNVAAYGFLGSLAYAAQNILLGDDDDEERGNKILKDLMTTEGFLNELASNAISLAGSKYAAGGKALLQLAATIAIESTDDEDQKAKIKKLLKDSVFVDPLPVEQAAKFGGREKALSAIGMYIPQFVILADRYADLIGSINEIGAIYDKVESKGVESLTQDEGTKILALNTIFNASQIVLNLAGTSIPAYNYIKTYMNKLKEDAGVADVYKGEVPVKKSSGGGGGGGGRAKTINKSDLKRYFPKQYNELYGEGSATYEIEQEVKAFEKEQREMKKKIKDQVYGGKD